jgi:vitamin B12 transporter
MFRYSLLSASLFAAMGGSAFAEEATLQPEIVVTASRVAQTVDTTLADVSVITRADIEASGTRDVSDMLRLQAGIDIARAGGPGSQTSIFLRGTNSNHVLVLVDGVRVSSLNTGAFTWETLPLDAIERIEIVRGPRASYWGSDAIGGVVQIFTRKLDGPRVSLGYGTYGDANANVGFGQRSERGGFSVQVGARDFDGFPSQNKNGFSYEPKDHGLENQHLTAQGDLQFGQQTLAANILRSQGHVEFAGGKSDFTEQAIDVSLSGQLADNWQHRLSVGNSREDYETPVYFSSFQTRRNSLGWQNEISVAERQRVIVGIDYLHEEGENLDTYSGTPVYRKSRNNTGLYAGWQGGFGAFDSELTIRNDDNSLFGNQSTGSAALGWRFADTLRAYASYGQGFRGPTLNEQYSPGFGGMFAGNSALDPEKSRSAELGLEFTPVNGQRLKASLYSTKVRDLISFTGTDFQAENIARAKIDGSELSYDGRFGTWLLGTAYTWQDPRNEDTDAQLLRRPKQKVSGTIERALGETVRIGAEVLYAGERKDVGGITLPSYTLLNLRASWALAPAWKFVARVENITDRNYELAHGYNTPERSGFLEVVWSPGK